MDVGISALAMQSASGREKSGIDRYCFGLIDALTRIHCDHRFTVFVSSEVEMPASWRAAGNFEFVRADGPFSRYKTLWDTFTAGAALRGRGLDVWLSTAHALPLWGGPAKVLVVHDLFSITHRHLYTPKHQIVIGTAFEMAVRRADRFIADSSHTRDELIRLFDVSPSRVSVTHLGLGNLVQRVERDAVERSDLARLGIPFPKFLFTLSTMGPRKNLGRLLEAFARLVGHGRHENLGLVIGGEMAGVGGEVLDLPRRLGIEDRVAFLGYIEDEDLPALFAACEAYVLASLIEGFGITVLEAMHYGAPVVCSATGSLPEVAGDSAIYFDPTDTVDMAETIERRLGSLDRDRLQVVQAGQKRAAEFSWERTAEETLRALELSLR